jgi:thiamine biosynthesis protein ThiI
MRMAQFLVRYGEIGLKSNAVRRRFEQNLRSNIENAFIRDNAECRVSADRGHIYVDATDARKARRILARTFGVISFSKVDMIRTDMEAICKYAVKVSKRTLKKGQTFAIRSRRTGNHTFTSRDVAVKAGDAIRLANRGLKVKVDLDEPDVEISIEVREKRTYFSTGRTDGPGGMPFGSQGKVVALVKDTTSALACWLMMKRGCRPIVIPVGKKGGRHERALELLGKWCPTGRLTTGPRSPALDQSCVDEAISYAKRKRANGLVIGSRDRIFEKDPFPIFYPLIGLNDSMMKDLKKKLR